jgi:L,D-transpeptidase catalytic domain
MGVGLLLLASSLSVITYHVEVPGTGGQAMRDRFTASQLVLLQKLNRADLDHLHRLAVLVVPDVWVEDERMYSPMPHRYPPGAAYRRLVLVYQPAQVFGAYEYGALVRWGPVSTGRRTEPTPSGLFHLNWRKRSHISTIDPEWIMDWAFNFENRVGLAFHEQALPGTPSSHGCVRLLGDDARWIFEWGDPWTVNESATRVLKLGTPVLIIGDYDFDAAPPWQSAEWLTRGARLPEM